MRPTHAWASYSAARETRHITISKEKTGVLLMATREVSRGRQLAGMSCTHTWVFVIFCVYSIRSRREAARRDDGTARHSTFYVCLVAQSHIAYSRFWLAGRVF